ncbi:MAG: ExbD/TolR family protein [Burkholderiaceae bacterium]
MSFGRFERTQGAAPFSDINVTPLVDVMLVLLVIFIITAPLLASSIRLDLPRSDAAQPQEAPAEVAVAIDAQGQVFLRDERVTLEQLRARLAPIAQRNPQAEVQLRADQTVPYGRVVEVMGAAQAAGLARIGFVADTAPAGR